MSLFCCLMRFVVAWCTCSIRRAGSAAVVGFRRSGFGRNPRTRVWRFGANEPNCPKRFCAGAGAGAQKSWAHSSAPRAFTGPNTSDAWCCSGGAPTGVANCARLCVVRAAPAPLCHGRLLGVSRGMRLRTRGHVVLCLSGQRQPAALAQRPAAH